MRPDLAASAQRADPLAQAAQAIAPTHNRIAGCRQRSAGAVVDDLNAYIIGAAMDANDTMAGAAVPDNVRYAFTHRPRERGLNRSWQGGDNPRVAFIAIGDTVSGQDFLRALQFAGERGLTVAGDGFAHFLQGGTRYRLDIANLGGCTLRGNGQQTPGQFAFQRDEREIVAEQIVKVARNAQSLVRHGEPGNLFARGTQFAACQVKTYHAHRYRPHHHDVDNSLPDLKPGQMSEPANSSRQQGKYE